MPLRAALLGLVAVGLVSHSVDAKRLRRTPSQDVSHSRIGTDFSIKMVNFHNVQYSAPFILDDQEMPVIYDTGSFEIIVLSTLCEQCSREHVLYDSKKSHSFVSSGGIQAEHMFGSGPVRSEKGFERVHLGTRASPYIAEHMPFWQVISHEIAVWDEHAHFSGIVGLGHPSHIPKGFSATDERDETMLSRMGVNSFAICLERSWTGAPGWLMLGPTIDKQPSVNSAFIGLTVVGEIHWGVHLTSFQIQGHPDVKDPCQSGCGVIIDSGTSLIAVPPSAFDMVEYLAGMIAQDCSNVHALPTLQMQLDGVIVELPPKAYVMKMKNKVMKNTTVWDWMVKGPTYEDVDECFAAFMAIDKQSQFGPVWILGMPFLRYYYTIFDRVNRKIHIAETSESCKVLPNNAALWNGSIGLVNKSLTGGVHHHRAFDMADYQPNVVDLNEARAPEWATGRDGPQVFRM